MNSFSLLLFILMVLILCRKAFKFEKLSRFERITLPSYSLIMFMLSMNWTITTFIQLILIIGISVVIGFYQLTKVEIKVEKNLDQYNRPVVLVKKYSFSRNIAIDHGKIQFRIRLGRAFQSLCLQIT